MLISEVHKENTRFFKRPFIFICLSSIKREDIFLLSLTLTRPLNVDRLLSLHKIFDTFYILQFTPLVNWLKMCVYIFNCYKLMQTRSFINNLYLKCLKKNYVNEYRFVFTTSLISNHIIKEYEKRRYGDIIMC